VVLGSNPGECKTCLFSTPVHSGPGIHQALPTTGTESCPAVKRPGRVVDYLSPNGAKVKSEKHNTSTLPVCQFDMFQGDLYLLQNIQIVSGAHATSCSIGSGASFTVLKRPGPHLLSKFKNQWGYTSVLPCDFIA